MVTTGRIAVHQFQNVRIIVIGTDDCDSFKVPVSAVFIVGHLAVLKTGIDKCDIVTLLLCLNFKTVEHTREIFMGKTAARLFLKEDSYIIGTFSPARWVTPSRPAGSRWRRIR